MVRSGELEALVMQRVWAASAPLTVRAVLDALKGERELAYTTVMTVMERLYRKRMLLRQEQGRAFVYSPAISRADYTAQMMTDALHGGGDARAALVHFAERLTSREKAALRAALDGARVPGKRA